MNALLGPDNRMLALARRGRRSTPPFLAFVVAFLVPTVFGYVGALLGISLVGPLVGPLLGGAGPALAGAADLVVRLVFGFGPIFLFLWAWTALFEGRPFWTLGLERGGALRRYGRGMLLGLAMFGAVVGIAFVLGYVALDQTGDPRLRGTGVLGAVLLVYLGWAVQGPAEEILSRGWLLQAVGVGWGPVAGVLVSSVFFALLHSLNPNLSPISVLNLFLVGVFLALWVLHEGSLWGVFAWHSVWNWAQGNLFGYEVSGSSFAGGALLDLRETGPDAVTGGPFGPEGGLAVTAVVVVGIAVVLALAARRKGRAHPAPADGYEQEATGRRG